jgi:hypothetical protein
MQVSGGGSESELDEGIELEAAGGADVGVISRYCRYVVVIAAAAAARLRWGLCARSCRYSRYTETTLVFS